MISVTMASAQHGAVRRGELAAPEVLEHPLAILRRHAQIVP